MNAREEIQYLDNQQKAMKSSYIVGSHIGVKI